MFRKRKPDNNSVPPMNTQQNGFAPGQSAGGPFTMPIPPQAGGVPSGQAMPPMPAPATISLLLLSSDYRRAEELIRALDHQVVVGRYAVTWVGTIEDLFGTLSRHQSVICFLDLSSPQVARLEGGGYQMLGNTPYLAVLTTASLSDGDPLLHQLEARGYYGYIGYPFDGGATHQVLTQIFQQLAPGRTIPASVPPAYAPMPMPAGASFPAPVGQSAPAGGSVPWQGTPDGASSGNIISQTPTPQLPPVATPLPPVASAPASAALQQASNQTQTIALNKDAAPATAAASAPPIPVTVGPGSFTIEPQLVRHRGLFVCWAPFDGAQRTVAALNLATILAFGGFRTLVGELRRPAGPLFSYLHLTEEELSRSLLAAAFASERLMKQKGYVLDQELLENHLLNAIPLDPQSTESPEVHFFLSGSAASPQMLFNAPALDPNQSPFVPELLQMIRQYWDFAFIIVGSSPVDKLHWQAFRACDRLLIFLPPDAAYLTQTGQLLPGVLRAAKIAPANVDVVLTQADRGIIAEQFAPILRFLENYGNADDRQARSLRGALSRRHPPMEDRYLRLLDRQLRKLTNEEVFQGRIEEEVQAILKACGLDNKLAGVLPDALPLMRMLRQQKGLLLPAVMQREFAITPYARAIHELLRAWIQLADQPPMRRQAMR
jgi:hypothetical protein